jgi:putative copper resistance protein D
VGDIVPAAPPSVWAILGSWTFEPTIAVPLLVTLVGWILLVWRIDRLHPESPVARWRSVAFAAGLAAIAVALLSGVGAYDDTLFSVHMVQHMLLVLVAAPLLLLAAPITQVLRAATPALRARWILPVLQSRVIRIAGHPVVAWLVFTAVMWASHFSPLFEAALENRGIHDAEHALFLGSALLFWWPAVGQDPSPYRLGHPARLMYVFLQMPMGSFLAMAILFVEQPLYAHYVAIGSPYGIDALADQKLAAGIMWFVTDVVFLGALLFLLRGWMRHEERGAAAADRRVEGERAALVERADRLAERRSGSKEPS